VEVEELPAWIRRGAQRGTRKRYGLEPALGITAARTPKLPTAVAAVTAYHALASPCHVLVEQPLGQFRRQNVEHRNAADECQQRQRGEAEQRAEW
jgi:hypothetical protein